MAKSERVATFSLGYRSGQDRQSRDHDWQPLLRLHCGRRLELRRRTALDWAIPLRRLLLMDATERVPPSSSQRNQFAHQRFDATTMSAAIGMANRSPFA